MLSIQPPKIMKVCGCGRKHTEVPASARYRAPENARDYFAGWYFGCACRSTLFVCALLPEGAA